MMVRYQNIKSVHRTNNPMVIGDIIKSLSGAIYSVFARRCLKPTSQTKQPVPLNRIFLNTLLCTTALSSYVTHAQETVMPFHGDVPNYSEEAISAGIEHQYDGPWEYFVGGGVATFDCNADRLPDLFIAGGANESALYVNNSQTGAALSFDKKPQPSTTIKRVTGAYPINLDNDEWIDLVVLRVGENRLLRGGPDCTFASANTSFGFDGGAAWTTAFSANFEAGAQYPTLAFGNYVDRTAPGSPWGTCEDNVLHRPQVPATNAATEEATSQTNLSVEYSEPTALSPGHCALSMLFTDWNKSGQDALRITNDRHYHRGGEEQLWRLDQDRYPRLFTRADGWQSLVIWGMGIAEGDLNADGFPEYILTSMGDTKIQSVDVVQASEEQRPVYEDIAFQRGATAHRPYRGEDLKPSTGWHAQLADVNNDSLLDLYIAKGNVEQMSDFASNDPDNLLLGNHDGRFVEHGEQSGIALDRRGRGASVADFNADGLLDLLVVNRGAPVSLFRNTGFDSEHGTRAGGNWLAIELKQTGSNRHALGARLAIKTGNKTQVRQIKLGGGHASGQLGFTHVGLGVAERATLRVQWPDGEWSASFRLFANHFAVITRDDKHVSYWYPQQAQE